MGSTGTNGTRKARSRSGRLRRRMMTAIDTRVKAASVPMLTISSSLPIGVSEATRAMTVPRVIVMRRGVPVWTLVLPSTGGSSQSRLMAKTTRVAPISSVMMTVVRPATAPAAINVAYPSLPTASKAEASAASGSIWS